MNKKERINEREYEREYVVKYQGVNEHEQRTKLEQKELEW